MDESRLSLIVTVSVLCAILVAFIVVITLYALRYNNLFAAFRVVIDNDRFCQPQEGECRLSVDDTLVQPTTVTDTFDYDTARYCADLIARIGLLYYDKNGVETLEMPPGLTNVKTLHFKDKSIGFVAKSPLSDIVWVAFRGTATESEWRHDFNFSQVDVELSTSADEQMKFTVNDESLQCHEGFLEVFNDFKSELLTAVGTGGAVVVVTGHSLGAALATLASLELSSHGHSVYTYVFGSPRVCEYIPTQNTMQGYWRVNNTTDIIPTIPLSVMPNMKQHDQPYIYTSSQNQGSWRGQDRL